jgi:hypothetical protein
MATPHPWGDLPPPPAPPLTQGSNRKVCPSLGIRHTLQPLILILVYAAAFKEIISLKIIEGKSPTLRHLNLFYSLKKKADSLRVQISGPPPISDISVNSKPDLNPF